MAKRSHHRRRLPLPPVRDAGPGDLLIVEQKLQDAACALRRAREAAPAPHRHAILKVERAMQVVAQRLVAAAQVEVSG